MSFLPSCDRNGSIQRFLIFPLLDCLRRRGLSTTSRDNQVQPEVFEMFNTAGSGVSLCAASHSECL